MDLWFEKYRPNSLDQLVISDIKKQALISWFEAFKKHETDECALLFIGPPGLGKTSLAHILLDHFGYKAKEFNASDIRSKALIKENMYGLINISDVAGITKMDKRPVGIIMDEVDGMFKGDRGGIEELLSYISVPSNRKKKVSKNFNRRIPIICICNVGNVKKETIKSLQKECYEVNFTLPDDKSLLKVLNRIMDGENMTIDEETQLEIIKYAQGDFRRLVGIVEFLYVTNGTNITSKHLDWCFDILSKKEQDLHITDSIKRLINHKLDGQTVHMIYDGDKSKAPMVVHQNYIQAICLQKVPPKTKIKGTINCMNSLITADVVEKTMYNTQCWHLQPIQGYTCALIPNYYINKYPKTRYVSASWASVLSVSSQSQNLRKNMYNEIYNVDSDHSYSIEDVQTIIEVVFHHLINGNIELGVKMLLDYNLTELEECNVPGSRKKALLTIDKIAKYIKISSYYNKWAKFRDNNKSNKDIDQQIKDCVKSYSKEPKVASCPKSDLGVFSGLKKIKPEPKLELITPKVNILTKPKQIKLKPVIKTKQEQIKLTRERKVKKITA